MEIEYACDPVRTADGGVDITVKFMHLEFEVPFHATLNDENDYGRDLYARAMVGEFGPVQAYVPPAPTQDEIKVKLVAAVQKHLDDTVKTHGYDGILSLCTYATDPDPVFSAEGQAGVVWRSECWRICYEVMAEVLMGSRGIPTEEDLIGLLPAFVWP